MFLESINDIPDCHQNPISKAVPVNIANYGDIGFFKSHNAKPVVQNHGQVIEHEAYIYIMRHPLDVFLSYLNFMRADVGGEATSKASHVPITNVESTIRNGDVKLYLDAFILFGTIQPTFLAAGSWFNNVENWIDFASRTKKPIAIIKYEDMLAGDSHAYSALADVLQTTADDIKDNVLTANKKTEQDGKFFWKKKSGNYKEMLSPELIAHFDKYHGDRTRKLGYEI
jgi:hypothetical protein